MSSPESSSMRPPAQLRERVLGAVRRAPASSVGLARSRAIRGSLGALGMALFALWFVRGSRGDGAAGHDPWSVFLVPATVAMMMTVGALRRGRGTFGPSVVQLAGASLLGPIALVLVALATRFDPESTAGMAAAAARVSEPHATLAAAVGLLLVLLALSPPADPTRATWMGAALGAAAGAWVSVSCGFTCPIVESMHVITLHIVYVPILAGTGAVLARLYDRWLFGRTNAQ